MPVTLVVTGVDFAARSLHRVMVHRSCNVVASEAVAVGLREVAAFSGVSIKTVSNVVNCHVHVAPATRARVQAAIAALGYVPNSAARQLRGGRSGVIALAVPDLRSPYVAELAGLIVRAAGHRSRTVLIDQTDGRLERERELAGGLRRHAIDGLILCSVALTEPDSISDQVPLVLVGERIPGARADQVAIDSAAAAADATRHLIARGRRRIAVIGAQDHPTTVTRRRLAGHRSALTGAGLPADPRLEATVDGGRRADGAAAMARLLDAGERPDAVFCCTDLLALGALRTLLARGIDVPGQVAVIGFGDVEDGRFSTPTLSTIAPDTERIAQLAVDLLVERISDGPAATAPPRELRAGHRLVPRESS
jgi:DNA-binding LacI/PurR family transcriptional regulator